MVSGKSNRLTYGVFGYSSKVHIRHILTLKKRTRLFAGVNGAPAGSSVGAGAGAAGGAAGAAGDSVGSCRFVVLLALLWLGLSWTRNISEQTISDPQNTLLKRLVKLHALAFFASLVSFSVKRAKTSAVELGAALDSATGLLQDYV